MDRIDENEEEAEDKYEADALMAVVTKPRPVGGMPRAATCDKTLRDMERAPGGLLPKRPTMPTMPRITSSASVSQTVRRRKESVISSLSHMDFTGSNLHIYIDVSFHCLMIISLYCLIFNVV